MRLKAVFDKFFTDRQVIIRTRGELKYLPLSVRTQLMGFIVLLGFGGLFAYLLTAGALQYREMTNQQAKLMSLQLDYDAVASDFELAQTQIAATRAELDQQYARLEDILADREVVEKALQFAVKSTDGDNGGQSLEDRIRSLGESLHATNARRERLEMEVMQANKSLFQISR